MLRNRILIITLISSGMLLTLTTVRIFQAQNKPATQPRILETEPYPLESCIAEVNSNDDITRIHLQSLLDSHGIRSMNNSGVVASIDVLPKDASRARAILLADARRQQYWIQFMSGEKFSAPRTAWKVTDFKKRYVDVLHLYPASTELGAALRYKDTKAIAQQYPILASVRSLRRNYLDADGRWKVGYQFTLILAPEQHPELSAGLDFQVWHQGQEVHMRGGYGLPGDWRARSTRDECGQNMMWLATALLVYCDANGKLPRVESWVGSLYPHLVSRASTHLPGFPWFTDHPQQWALEQFHCPADRSREVCSYAMNPRLSGKVVKGIPDARHTVLLYETSHPGWNPIGSGEDICSPGRHLTPRSDSMTRGNWYITADLMARYIESAKEKALLHM